MLLLIIIKLIIEVGDVISLQEYYEKLKLINSEILEIVIHTNNDIINEITVELHEVTHE